MDIEDDDAVKTRVKRKARLMYDYDDDADDKPDDDKNTPKGKDTMADRAIKSIFFFAPRNILRGAKKIVEFAEGGFLAVSNSLRVTFTKLINSMS